MSSQAVGVAMRIQSAFNPGGRRLRRLRTSRQGVKVGLPGEVIGGRRQGLQGRLEHEVIRPERPKPALHGEKTGV